MHENPLVSIVMPSFNQAQFIEEALDSLLTQSWQHFEVIVQDGGSTDGTQELLADRSAKDKRIRWASEPDNGPADAINKALDKARGTYIGWLNSDDCFTPGAVERAVNAFKAHPEWILCYGQGQHIDEKSQFTHLYATLPDIHDPNPEVPEQRVFQQGCFICQPTVYFKATMLTLIGKLNTDIKASFDFDYWVRAFKAFPGRIGYLPDVQASSRLHENTITYEQRLRVAVEGIKLLAEHQGAAQSHWMENYMHEQIQRGRNKQELYQEAIETLPTLLPCLPETEQIKLQQAVNQLSNSDSEG